MTASRKVLIVDDSPEIIEIVGIYMEMEGYKIDSASNGLEALKKIEQGKYCFVITDLQMPEMDGICLYQGALKDAPYLKDNFIFISGGADRESFDYIEKTGCPLVKKPFTYEDIKGALKNIYACQWAKK